MLKTTMICALILTSLSIVHAAGTTVLPDRTLETSEGTPVNLQDAVNQRATTLIPGPNKASQVDLRYLPRIGLPRHGAATTNRES
jgi:hypothetical protein